MVAGAHECREPVLRFESMSRRRLRYRFAITEGANAGLGCGGWRIWVHDDSVYISAKGSPWKASLHADDSWRVAVTSEHVRLGRAPVIPNGRATAWEFKPTRFGGGGRMAFVVAVTRNALNCQEIDATEIVIPVADRWDQITLLYVWMTEAGVGLSGQPVIGGPLPLSNGHRVWVTAGVEDVGPCEPEPVPSGLAVFPKSPTADGVAAPGFLVRGVTVA